MHACARSPRVVRSYMGHIQATAERAVRDMLRQFSVDQVCSDEWAVAEAKCFACACVCGNACPLLCFSVHEAHHELHWSLAYGLAAPVQNCCSTTTPIMCAFVGHCKLAAMQGAARPKEPASWVMGCSCACMVQGLWLRLHGTGAAGGGHGGGGGRDG